MAENNRRRGPHGPGPGAIPDKAKDFKGTVRKLLRYIAPYRIAIILVMIFAVGSTVFHVIGPKILGSATTELFKGLMAKLQGTGGIDYMALGRILTILLMLYVISALLSFLQGWIMTNLTQKMTYQMRKEIAEKINRMPLAYFESNQIGDIQSRITNDVDTLGSSLNQSITTFITSFVTLVGVLIMMFSISSVMTWISLIIIPLSAILVLIIVKHSQKYFKQQQDYLGKINGQIEETFSGHDIVTAFHQEENEIRSFEKTNHTLYTAGWKSQFLSGLMMPILNLVANIGYVAVAISGSILAARGTIQVGDIVSFVQYVKRFTQPITQLAQVSNMMQSMVAAAERIFEFMEQPDEVRSAEDPADPESITGQVTFDHVRFGYSEDTPVIHDFSCDVKQGQMIAIVGPTGAGKTTLVKLLMRFYDVNSGAILLDGHDVRSFDRDGLRSGFGMVLQDTWLFNDTIMENIRYGRLDATDEEVKKAAKAAHADHFIRTLPGGYQMKINEDGTNVSAGQKQLITIARAILADRKILILDEATSSVDTRTEHLIQDAMNNLMKGRTSFVIAHRLSTIRSADKILVLNHGDIVEQRALTKNCWQRTVSMRNCTTASLRRPPEHKNTEVDLGIFLFVPVVLGRRIGPLIVVLDMGDVVGRRLIQEVVDPVAVDQMSAGSPPHHRRLRGIIIGIVVFRDLDGLALGGVPVVLLLHRRRWDSSFSGSRWAFPERYPGRTLSSAYPSHIPHGRRDRSPGRCPF